MALYHLSVKYISRGKGRTAIAAAAYRSGEKLYDHYYGETHDFTEKRGIVYTEILLPENAPSEFRDRETLWNAVEKAEKRRDARLAREVEIALPKELTLAEQIELARCYVIDNFISQGMCADIAIHDKGNGNPHAHILLTTRFVDKTGFIGKNRDWNRRENVTLWRRQWANIQNREYEHKGLKMRVSHESYIQRGFKRKPTRHRGPLVSVFEKMGIQTDLGTENRAIIEKNRQHKIPKLQHYREREQNFNRNR